MVVNGDAVTLMLTGVERYATLNADFNVEANASNALNTLGALQLVGANACRSD